MAVTDQNKVWMGGQGDKLKLFDLHGHFHHSVSTADDGMFLNVCTTNK